ncbi:heme exporter protein CcmD [Parasphingorhabdus sp.]
MNHGSFVFAAYAIVLICTAAVVVNSFVAMRRAERKADQLSKRK